jgi:hypothetical protein
MPDWREFLKPAEADRLEEIATSNRALKREYRQIYDRCRKRMKAQRSK